MLAWHVHQQKSAAKVVSFCLKRWIFFWTLAKIKRDALHALGFILAMRGLLVCCLMLRHNQFNFLSLSLFFLFAAILLVAASQGRQEDCQNVFGQSD